MFLFSSINIEQRVKAKEWLKGAIQIIIGVNVSFYLYKLVLELASAITQFMWVTGFEQFFSPSNYASLDIAYLSFYLFSISFTAITLFIRHLFLLGGVIFFPIGIFLYFIPPLKNWGKLVFNLIGIFLFMQFLDAIIFIASNQIVQDIASQEFASIVPALAFLIVGVINVLLVLYALFHAAFSFTQNTPTIVFATGIMASQIPKCVCNLLKNMASKFF